MTGHTNLFTITQILGGFHMNRPLQRSVAVGLAVCLLLLSALVYPQTVAHAAQHAHHKAATHATALCTWMCAAGQVLEGVAFDVQSPIGPVRLAGLAVLQTPPSAVLPASASRGPPPRFI